MTDVRASSPLRAAARAARSRPLAPPPNGPEAHLYTQRSVATTGSTWTPSSWRALPAGQQPVWPDAAALAAATERLRTLPPLVFAGEARALVAALGEVCEGRAFLLQAGDCVESFRDVAAPVIREKLKVLLQMSAVLTYGATLPVVRVGRIAGQFAKPRSEPVEVVDGVELPSFRGHIVHSDEPTPEARVPDPERLVQGYYHAAATLNLLRAFTKGGFADLTLVHTWNREFVAASPAGRRYEALADEIERALRFMQAIGIDLASEPTLHQVDVWTSHEGLLLEYEEALTRTDSLTGRPYDCSAHMLWIGERTRELDGAHVEFFSGVDNPVGVKLGPAATPEEAVALAERLNPDRIPGRLTFIVRMGAGRVREALPPLLRAVREAGVPVVWACDPMHANLVRTRAGAKTRHFDTIMAELEGFFAAHREVGTWPGGVHLEFTGEDVTECLGGAEAVLEEQLDHRYETLCDPRLNGRQSLDLAFRVAELMRAA
ncbi:MAG TPA: 3-deoxy-7-phosphoheptulonate synthase class II [Gaiellaceae bacterium]|nr:3-deoxy-7-phosphoheptulonate synthase class II [Gaiellaceae bacterium]